MARPPFEKKISIHVLREEDDAYMTPDTFKFLKISIHVLREEDDSKCDGK